MNISNYGKLLPFDMEVVLARRGAKLIVCSPETRPDKAYTHIVDEKNRLVTGAFATSAQWVAEENDKAAEIIPGCLPSNRKTEGSRILLSANYSI